MKNDLAGKYMLKNDIDLSSTTHTPIGDHNAAFTGKFDGMFHEVKNMTLSAGTAADHAGLFGNINGAVVMNVGIKNANLSSLDYGGAVVGKAENSHIFNVYNESTSMIGSTGSSATNAGGLFRFDLAAAARCPRVFSELLFHPRRRLSEVLPQQFDLGCCQKPRRF